MKPIGVIISVLLLLAPGRILAAPPIFIDGTQKKYPLGMHLDLIEDADKKLTFEDIRSDQFSSRWKASHVNAPNFGYTASAFWVRFTIKNSSPQADYYLEAAFPYLDRVDIYIPASGKYIQKTSGDHFPFHTREIQYRNFVFPIPIPKGEQTYYMRFDSILGDNLILPITLWTCTGFAEMVNFGQTVIGIYYGCMFLMLIYSLFFFVTLREKNYLYHIWAILGFVLFQACEDGLATEYLWPDNFWLTNYSSFFIAMFGVMGMLQFTRTFLNTPQLMPKLDKLIIGLLYTHIIYPVILLFVILLQPTLPAIVPTIIPVLATCTFVLFLVSGLICLKKNFRPAGYFLMADTALLSGLVLVMLRITGVLPVVLLTQYGAQMGSVLCIMLLLLGLVDKINITKQEREEYLHKIYSLINSSRDLIFLKDTNLCYQIANREHEAVFHVKVDDIIGKTDHDFMPEAEAVKCLKSDMEALHSGYVSAEERIADRNFHVVKHKVLDAKNNIQGIAAVIRDITDQKKIESEKRELNERLQQAQRLESIGTLAGGIAHDFNNILYAAIGFTELAYDEVPKGSEAAQCLQNVMVSHKRGVDLINQILTFSRQYKQDPRPIRLQPVIKEALNLIRKIIPTNIEIRQNINEECGLIMADVTQILQVVMNLCTNAYHAMQVKGGVITIRLENAKVGMNQNDTGIALAPGDYIQLEVSDTGKGMEPAVLNRIFEPFFTTKDVGKGTGLGLAMVHGIVKEYGGVIHVESRPDQGTAFHLFFPVCSLEEKEEISKDEAQDRKGAERILFVDDDEMIVRFVEKSLGSRGYHIQAHADGVKALEAFRADPLHYDLVVTDMNMPSMTGLELAEKILEIRPAMPVILCTGFSEAISREKVRAKGIAELLHKPLITKDLLSAIRNLMDGAPQKETKDETNSGD